MIVFHYRGYGPSTGRPSAANLLSDSLLVHDYLQEVLGSGEFVGIGFSIGSGVAAHLASQRPLAGLIMVSPFDSLKALAAHHYPWLPVSLLLRHNMEPEIELQDVDVPTAVIAAELDSVVPPRRTESLRQAIVNLVLDHTIAGANHNDLYDRPEFRSAMIEALGRIRSKGDD